MTSLSVSLERYDDRLREEWLALLPHQAAAAGAGKLDWKFRQNPAGDGLISVARICGDVVGINAFMPVRFDGFGAPGLAGFQSMDTIVAPAARGQGAFTRMVQAFQDAAPGDILYGFPNLSSSPGFFGKLGWTHLAPAPMLILPIRSGLFLKRLHPRMPDIALPTFNGRSDRYADVEPISRFDARVDAVWGEFARTNGVRHGVQRDATFLNWRLFDHPVARYSAATVGHRAYAAWCLEEKHGGRVGYIMDVFGDDMGVRTLVGYASARLKELGADAVFAWNLPHMMSQHAYRAAGYWSLPDRLRPIRLNFGGRPLRSEIADFNDLRRWHVSYLDSDTV